MVVASNLAWHIEDEYGRQAFLERLVDNNGKVSWVLTTIAAPNDAHRNNGSFLSEQDLLKLRDAINVEIFGG